MVNKLFLDYLSFDYPICHRFFIHWPHFLMFIIYCLTIITLAGYMGRATESLAIVLGPGIGGLLNATFGNAVVSLSRSSLLKTGLIAIVLASLTGSILGNLLLVGVVFLCWRNKI